MLEGLLVEEPEVDAAELEGDAAARTPTDWGVTSDVSSAEFRYGPSPSRRATLSNFQPFCAMSGNACMNAPTVSLLSSCSRMIRPGDLGPVIHFWRFASTSGRVAPPASPMLQSSVLCVW